MIASTHVKVLDISIAKRRLDQARAHGDLLKIELAEAALNDLLDRMLTDKTDKTEGTK